MRIIIRPMMEPQREIDLTQRLVAAIAEELWRVCGGNDHLNWMEAENHLRRIVGDARIEGVVADASRADVRDSVDNRLGPARRNGSAPFRTETADAHGPASRRRINRRHLVASIHE